MFAQSQRIHGGLDCHRAARTDAMGGVELDTGNCEPRLDHTAEAGNDQVPLCSRATQEADTARGYRRGIQAVFRGCHRQSEIRMCGAVLTVDGVVTSADAIGLENARPEATRLATNATEYFLHLIITDRWPRQERPRACDVGVHDGLRVRRE